MEKLYLDPVTLKNLQTLRNQFALATPLYCPSGHPGEQTDKSLLNSLICDINNL
jgi:hypothetical protein